jgi:hypothetical protein
MVGLLRGDELEAAHRVSGSLAKKATAFHDVTLLAQLADLAAQAAQLLALSVVSPSARPWSTSAGRTQVLST